MADTTVKIGSTGIEKKLHDNSDDTYSDAVHVQSIESGAVVLGAGSDVDVPLAPENLVPNGTQADQALTVDATVGGVQFAAFHADTTHVEIDVQDAQIRVTFDNSAPTSSNGHLLNPYSRRIWPKTKAAAAKFIRTGSTSAVVHASQLRGA